MPLRIAVTVYMVVIGVMAGSAIAAGLPIAIAGALLFMLSDSMIAWNRFVAPFAGARLAIIVTYHVGQALLVYAPARLSDAAAAWRAPLRRRLLTTGLRRSSLHGADGAAPSAVGWAFLSGAAPSSASMASCRWPLEASVSLPKMSCAAPPKSLTLPPASRTMSAPAATSHGPRRHSQ